MLGIMRASTSNISCSSRTRWLYTPTHRRASSSDSDSGFSPWIGRWRSAPSQAAPAASSLLEAMPTSCSKSRSKSRLIASGFIRVPRITKRDPVSHHPGPAEQTRALDGVFAEPIADRIHRGLEPLLARTCWFGEKIKLAASALAQPRQADPESAHAPPRIPRRQQLQGGLVDLAAGRDRCRLLRLPREMAVI